MVQLLILHQDPLVLPPLAETSIELHPILELIVIPIRKVRTQNIANPYTNHLIFAYD